MQQPGVFYVFSGQNEMAQLVFTKNKAFVGGKQVPAPAPAAADKYQHVALCALWFVVYSLRLRISGSVVMGSLFAADGVCVAGLFPGVQAASRCAFDGLGAFAGWYAGDLVRVFCAGFVDLEPDLGGRIAGAVVKIELQNTEYRSV